MKKLYTILFAVFALLFQSCTTTEKDTNWKPQYSTESKDPYGFYLFRNALPSLFPDANIKEVPFSGGLSVMNGKMLYHKDKSLYICIAKGVNFDYKELQLLDDWLYAGNDVVIVAEIFNDTLIKALGMRTKSSPNFAKSAKTIVRTQTSENQYHIDYYKYPIFDFYFENHENDSFKTLHSIVGKNEVNNAPNFISYQIGAGRLMIHSAPMAFSNYFLLNKNNRNYLQDVFAYTQSDVKQVYVSVGKTRSPQHSDWSVLWRNKATRMALILSIVALVLYVLFKLKRRQKIIPEIAPLKNEAASFVETIGELYYHQRDNRNLANKMIQHFWEFVRSNYQLNTNELDADFEQRLSARAGKPLPEVNYLLTQIKQVQEQTAAVTDAFLFALYKNIQCYYQTNHK